MKAKEFIIELKKQSKPRNFVAKNASLAGKAGQHKDKKKAEKQGDVKHKKEIATMESALSELSTEKLAQYKKAAGADAKKADADGNYSQGNKRFKGINRATNKQFDNDLKKHGVAEDHRDDPMYGLDADFDNMLLRREAKRKGMSVAQYKNYLEKQKQDQEHELNIGSSGRAELKQKADELAEIKREKLRNERLQDEDVAFQRAETAQQRKDEMKKIADKYQHDLTVIDKEHRNNMEAIRTGNNHETDKMSMEFRHEKEMWDRNNPQQKPQSSPEKPIAEPEEKPRPRPRPEAGNNFDQDTGEPIRPQSNQWHTSQQVGYRPSKPSKDNDDDIIDVEPKPNKPLRIKEKITLVKDPAKATGIQRTGGITHGSVYSGKPLPQSLQQKLDGKPNASRAVDAKGRTQQQWVKLVKAKFPDAKIMQSKMLDGPVFAMLPDGRKLSWNKVEQGVEEASLGDYREKALKQKAQSRMGAMFNDPDALATFNKRERGLNRLKARDEVARKSTADKQMADNIAKLPELKAEYERMKAEYKSLGGSNWQYADREQNLTDRERKARSMEGPINNLWRTISAAEKAQKSQGVGEGWKDKVAAAGLAGAMAFGAGGANARVTPDGQGGYTGGWKPTATVNTPSDNKSAAEAPKGYNKEYLQKAANPDRFGRYMISVEKAQELLKQMDSKVGEGSMFAGAKVGHKEGPAGQWRNDGAKKNKPAKPGDLVGGGM